MFTSGRFRTWSTALALLTALAIGVTTTTAAASPAKNGPISVAYIEVNSNSMLSVGNYTLASGGGNVFDIGVIFAANINYDTTTNSAYLYFNPQVQSVLDNVSTQIRPLQAKGIKVELSILGNHQGAGFANFPSQAAASAFAKQLSDAVTQYGLDGIDFDDEYADYGNNGTGQPNASSFVYLVSALRQDMPNKLITLYDIGPAASHVLRWRRCDPGYQLRVESLVRLVGRTEHRAPQQPVVARGRRDRRNTSEHRGQPGPANGGWRLRRVPDLQLGRL